MPNEPAEPNKPSSDISVTLQGASAKGDPGTIAGTATMALGGISFGGRVVIHEHLPADHAMYSLVGRVASEWSHLEHILDIVIWDLLRIDNRLAACITAQIMGVGPRCKAITTLGFAMRIPDDLLKPFRKLAGDSFSVADWRARFVHDPWYIEVGTEGAAQFRAMPAIDLRYGIHEIEKAELDATLAKIKELQERAISARQGILNWLAKSL